MRGWSELVLLAGVLCACWTRTPLGALGEALVAVVSDEPVPDLLASFSTELPEPMTESLHRVLALPPQGRGEEGSAALRTAIVAHLGEQALAEVEALGLSDPEEALEVWVVGQQARDRAIRRARAAGEAEPARYEAHRRFLSEAEARRAKKAVEETLALATVLDLRWPVDAEARVSSPFGYRTHPTLGTRKLHEGVDIALPVGTPVHAAGPGRVVRARFDKVNGEYVSVDHGHGVRTSYCHGDALHVEAGRAVEAGQHIMDSGNSGRSTGPHLHFGLRVGGRAIDPAPFRKAGAEGAPVN